MTEYTSGQLSKIASLLYKSESEPKTRMEIYKAIGTKLHPKSIVYYSFAAEHLEVIEGVEKELEKAIKKAAEEKKRTKNRKKR